MRSGSLPSVSVRFLPTLYRFALQLGEHHLEERRVVDARDNHLALVPRELRRDLDIARMEGVLAAARGYLIEVHAIFLRFLDVGISLLSTRPRIKVSLLLSSFVNSNTLLPKGAPGKSSAIT